MDFLEALSKKLSVSSTEGRNVLGTIVGAIATTLDEQRSLGLSGLGTFDVEETRGLVGRNPMTGEAIRVPARKKVRFAKSLGPHALEVRRRVGVDAENRLDAFVATIVEGLEDGGVTVPGLGTFLEKTKKRVEFTAAPELDARIRFMKDLPRELRPPRSTWKSVSELEPEDFQEHPLWGFDLGRGESEPGADESFVRPYDAVEADAEFSETYFARARIVVADGSERSGALSFHFERGEAVIQHVAVFGNEPFTVQLLDLDFPPHVLAMLEPSRKCFPLRYEVRVPTENDGSVELAAQIDPFRPREERPRGPDGFDLEKGLGELLWTDDVEKIRARFEDVTEDEPLIPGVDYGCVTLRVPRLLVVRGVELKGMITVAGGRVATIAMTGEPPVDLEVQRALARQLGAPDRLRLPGLNSWTSGGCRVQLSSQGPEHFACIVTPGR